MSKEKLYKEMLRIALIKLVIETDCYASVVSARGSIYKQAKQNLKK